MSSDYVPSVESVRVRISSNPIIDLRGKFDRWETYSNLKIFYGLNDNWLSQEDYYLTICNFEEALDIFEAER